MRRPVIAVLAAAVVLTGAPVHAQAAPGDPAPGWPTQVNGYTWSVAVSQSGRVSTLALPVPGESAQVLLSSSYDGTWPTPTDVPGYTGDVRAGPGAYAIAVTRGDDDVLVSRELVSGRWAEPRTIGAIDRATTLDANTDGDTVLVWRSPEGPTAGIHPRGGTWTTLPVPVVPEDGYFAAAINDTRKVTVVWAEATGTTTQAVRRTVLRPGATAWTTPQTLGTVPSGGAPRIVTDGQGRETITAGGKLWRQETTNSTPAYAFAVGPDAVLAAGTTDTRVAWPHYNGRYVSVRTRHFKQTSTTQGWRPTTTLWARTYPEGVPALCRSYVNVGLDMAPAGRSYVAFGAVARGGCPEGNLRLVTLDRTSTPLNDVVVADHYGYGTAPDVTVGARGPVAVDYQTDGADNGWGDTNYLDFFSR